MYRLLDCITQEHHFGLVAVAALICVIGSVISVHMSGRLTEWTGKRRLVQLPLAGLITGATIWSTHFIAMTAYEPGYEHGYEPILTGASLLVGVLGSFAANAGACFCTRSGSTSHGRCDFWDDGVGHALHGYGAPICCPARSSGISEP